MCGLHFERKYRRVALISYTIIGVGLILVLSDTFTIIDQVTVLVFVVVVIAEAVVIVVVVAVAVAAGAVVVVVVVVVIYLLSTSFITQSISSSYMDTIFVLFYSGGGYVV